MSEEAYEQFTTALWIDISDSTGVPEPEFLLAHYTSVQTMESILKTGEVWLSNPLFMNDLDEIRFGMTSGAEEFRDSDILRATCKTDAVYESLIRHFDSFYDPFANHQVLDVYVMCFCEHDAGDTDGRLSMWRAYGADGGGVAMVVRGDRMHALEDSPLVLAKVQYASNDQRRDWIRNSIQVIARELDKTGTDDKMLFYAAHAWLERLKLFSLFSKHSGFSEEQEWRVVYLGDRDPGNSFAPMIGYLVTTRGIEPKLKLPLHAIPGAEPTTYSLESLVDRIILGPSASTNLAKLSFQRMLSLLRRDDLVNRVRASSIPYRS